MGASTSSYAVALRYLTEKEGAELLLRASEAGNTEAMELLAEGYQTATHGLPLDLDQAARWFEAARLTWGMYSVACTHYDDGHRGGATPARDVAKAVALWSKAAAMGEHGAMARLGWCYQHGVGVGRDPRRAAALYADAVGKERRHSWRLGVCYLRGEGVERDWAAAVELLSRSNFDECAHLAWCYMWGCGVARHPEKSIEYLTRAAGGRAKVFLGCCYERGIGVERDSEMAGALYEEGKQSRDGAEALGELGVHFRRGDCGVSVDERAAARYFEMGAEGGDPVSMFQLGVCLRDGDGVDCNAEQAHNWLQKAAWLEHKEAEKLLLQDQQAVCEAKTAQQPQQDAIDALKKEIEALKAEVAEVKKRNEQLQCENRQSCINLEEAFKADKEELTRRNDEVLLKNKELEAALFEERFAVADLKKELLEEAEKSARSEDVVNTMISLISATIDDFRVDTLLGSGSNAAAFKVQHIATLDSSAETLSASSTGVAPAMANRRGYMVMKVLCNWDNTPRDTMLRQKYMAECVILSLLPNHPNVIHPLGTLVIPFLPAPFVEKIPNDKPFFKEELRNGKSLAILMPHCGITLSAYLSSSLPSTAAAAQNLFFQALKAIHHLEAHSVVHRDIKADNILVDPESGKLTLIDFGEAQHCQANMEVTVSATTTSWGSPGTIPPELSTFLKSSARGISGVFSYSKCDSFALALTFWDALLPPSHKFIGSTMNHDMSAFTTQSLTTEFPVPLFSVTTTSDEGFENYDNNGTPEILLKSVMIGMMNPDKAARVSAADAISSLTPTCNP
ncbi:sel1 repeat family protein [Pelomyxa schiedti]|nr:sel1 repeat family protein [Pelomyxa schiedti]